MVTTSDRARRMLAISRARNSVSACTRAALLTVALGLGPVALLLAVLGQQDERRGVGGLGGEHEVEQDERVRVPLAAARRRR